MVLPLGISFFTFTQIGYLVDCGVGKVEKSDFLNYSFFVTFFPHIIAGPIVHQREILPQLTNRAGYRLNAEDLAIGLTLFFIGLFKKDVIADGLSPTADALFLKPVLYSPDVAWVGVLSYSLQLYFDFSGYSDMAIGLGRMFGIHFPTNFDSPYCATCIIDFWQRWHMTLTRYLTLYLYNPISLSISRYRVAHGIQVSRNAVKSLEGFTSLIAFPTITTILLAGIWHGAGLQFIIFGLLHGIYLTINHAYRVFCPKLPAKLFNIDSNFACIGLTYLCVVIAQVFFRAASVSNAIVVLESMFGVSSISGTTTPSEILQPSTLNLARLYICYLIVFIFPNSLRLLEDFSPSLSSLRSTSLLTFKWSPASLGWLFYIIIIASFALLSAGQKTDFIYFRF
jgi:D-alanyl-lipoteichoic acid acyltransferase DltB (MBOAT superfamily)